MFLVTPRLWSVHQHFSLMHFLVIDTIKAYPLAFGLLALYAMPSPLISPPTSISKPSIRKHPSSDNLCAYHLHHHHHHQVQQQEKVVFTGCPPLPSSPSRKAASEIYICIGFIFFFVFITTAGFLHGNEIEKTTISTDTNVVAMAIATHPKSRAIPALKGLGTLFRRGTRAMTELVVAHVPEDTQMQDFRLFLRTLHRSGVPARADIVFLFSSSPLTSMLVAIHEEDEYFQSRLLFSASDYMVADTVSNSTSLYRSPPHVFSNASISPFNANAYRKADSESEPQPIWGSHIANFSHINQTEHAGRYHWGSMVGFDVTELNPDDNLQGFVDHPPLTLRRWACYQMLLGMVKHRFKNVLLTNVKSVVFLGDPFVVVRRRGGLYVSMEDRAWGTLDVVESGAKEGLSMINESRKLNVGRDRVSSSSKAGARRQGRKRYKKAGGLYEHVYGKSMWSSLEEFEKRKKLVNSGAILGGIQQIRGLANTMVTEIVKVALDRSNRKAFPDNVLLSYLLHKSSSVLGKRVLDHLHVLENGESFVHSLVGSQQHSLFLKRTRVAYAMVYGGNITKRWVGATRVVRQDICSSPVDATVYIDCKNAHIVSRKASVNV